MKWEYKVVHTSSFLPREDDHDIAISQDAAQARGNRMSSTIEERLNALGAEGWELVNFSSEFAIFRKH